jgi:hypothetical protein
MTQSAADAERLISAIEKLVRHVSGLQRDVQRLSLRFRCVDPDASQSLNSPPWDGFVSSRLRGEKVTLLGLAEVIRQSDWQLQSTERAIGFIEHKIIQAESGNETPNWRSWLLDADDRLEQIE